MTRIDAMADAANAEPLAATNLGNAMPDTMPMIAQTNRRSMIAKPCAERFFTRTSEVSQSLICAPKSHVQRLCRAARMDQAVLYQVLAQNARTQELTFYVSI